VGPRLNVAVRPYDATRDAEAFRALTVEHQDFARGLEPSWPEGKAVLDEYVAFLEKECATHDGCVMIAESGGAWGER